MTTDEGRQTTSEKSSKLQENQMKQYQDDLFSTITDKTRAGGGISHMRGQSNLHSQRQQ